MKNPQILQNQNLHFNKILSSEVSCFGNMSSMRFFWRGRILQIWTHTEMEKEGGERKKRGGEGRRALRYIVLGLHSVISSFFNFYMELLVLFIDYHNPITNNQRLIWILLVKTHTIVSLYYFYVNVFGQELSGGMLWEKDPW